MAKSSQCGKCAGCKKGTMCTTDWTNKKNEKNSGAATSMTPAKKKASGRATVRKGR